MTRQEAVERVTVAMAKIACGEQIAREIAELTVEQLAQRGEIDVPEVDRA